jgi:hypothetical protein
MLYRSPPSEENVSLRTMGLPPAHLHLLGPFFIKVWAKPRLFFGQPAGCTPKGIFYALPNQAYQAVLYSLFSSQ